MAKTIHQSQDFLHEVNNLTSVSTLVIDEPFFCGTGNMFLETRSCFIAQDDSKRAVFLLQHVPLLLTYVVLKIKSRAMYMIHNHSTK